MDYTRFRYKPFDPATVSELETLPEFQFDFRDKAKAISYLILVWEPQNRDWQKQYTRYVDMKREAALLAGFTLQPNNRFTPEVEDLIIGANPAFNRAVIRYLYLTGIPELPALSAHRELQSAEMEAAFNPNTDAKVRKEIRVNIDAGTLKISEYEEKIFGGREVEALRTELYKYMESLKLALRPEYIAQATKQGRLAEVLDIKPKRGRPKK